jgi:GTPase SAR1 family protein
MSKIEMDEDEAKTRIALNNHIEYDTQFNFINYHKGFRRGKLHVLLGDSSSGKSTLVKSILGYQTALKRRIFLWLSEESCEDFKDSLAFTDFDKSIFENIRAVSEVDIRNSLIKKGIKNADEEIRINFYQKIKNEFLVEKPDIFIFDNVTTSACYNDLQTKEQGDFAGLLKSMCIDFNIPFLLVAHTSVTNKKKLFIGLEDIRGSKTLSNIAEFFYTVQKKELKNPTNDIKFLQFARVLKSRNQPVYANVSILKFNSLTRMIDSDYSIDYAQFKEFMEDVSEYFK